MLGANPATEIFTNWAATNQGAGHFICNGVDTNFASVWTQGPNQWGPVGDNQGIKVATKAYISDGSTALSNTVTINIPT